MLRLTHADIAQGGFWVFVRFEYDWGYGALDAFDLIDFLLQDISELFHARGRNYRNDVKFPFDVIDLLDVFELWEGVNNLLFLTRIDEKVNWGFESVAGLHFTSSKHLSSPLAFERFWEPKSANLQSRLNKR